MLSALNLIHTTTAAPSSVLSLSRDHQPPHPPTPTQHWHHPPDGHILHVWCHALAARPSLPFPPPLTHLTHLTLLTHPPHPSHHRPKS
jgi:hypothetical protein